MKKVLLIVAQQGFRDEELFETKKVLEKKGIKVDVASITPSVAHGKLGGTVQPDIAVKDAHISEYEYVGVIGGPGAPLLGKYPEVIAALKKAKHIAAICIAPTILAQAGLLKGKKATVFETPESVKMLRDGGAVYTGNDVEVDGDLVTANGPEAAKRFGEELAKKVLGVRT